MSKIPVDDDKGLIREVIEKNRELFNRLIKVEGIMSNTMSEYLDYSHDIRQAQEALDCLVLKAKQSEISKMREGTYWVGDPCYVLKEENGFSWKDILSDTNYFRSGINNIFELNPMDDNKRPFSIACSETAYGDGGYPDQFGNSYGVDAGMIACIPVDRLTNSVPGSKSDKYFHGKELGIIHDFPDYFHCFYSEGTIVFGHIKIETKEF